MSRITSFCMFFLSFLPLWISVLFIDIKSVCEEDLNVWTEIISILLILIVSAFSFVILLCGLNSRNSENQQEYKIINANEEKTITSEYLLSYILPLFAFDFTLWNEVVLFLIFFLTFAFLSIRHSHFSVNILLELLRYRFYSCELENEDGILINKIVISQEILSAQIGGMIYATSLNNEYIVSFND